MHSPAFDDRSSAPAPKTHAKRTVLLWGVGLLLLAVVTLPQGMTAPHVEAAKAAYLSAPVTRGELLVTLTEQGLVDSGKNYVVSSECEWSARIIEIIPEGTYVEEGEVVVQLDTSELTERLKEREIQLIDAKSRLVQAQETLAMQELENQSGRARAELALTLARLDLEKYEHGEFPKAEKDARAALAMASEDVSRSHERCEYIARLVAKGYESAVALEQEQTSLLRYQNKLDTAQRALDVLVDHTRGRKLTELRGAVSTAESELERVERLSKIAMLNRQVQVNTRQKNYDATREYVERLEKSIAACTFRAPRTGEVIYANEGSVRDEIVEGAIVRNRQDVVRIPNLEQMHVALRVHESQIEGVRKGLPASIRIDAFPELDLSGRVESVSRVPTVGSNRFMSDLKEYDAIVAIDTSHAPTGVLKPGLTAKVVIQIDRQPDCLQVPVQSVVKLAGQHIVFVETPQGIAHREIEVGKTSDVAVEVVTGLSESERVLLSPRTTCSEQLIAIEAKYSSETSAANIGG